MERIKRALEEARAAAGSAAIQAPPSPNPSGHSASKSNTASRRPQGGSDSKKARHHCPEAGMGHSPFIARAKAALLLPIRHLHGKGARAIRIALLAVALVVAFALPIAWNAGLAMEPGAEVRLNSQPLIALGEAASSLWRKATSMLDETGVSEIFRRGLTSRQGSDAIPKRVQARLDDGAAATEQKGEPITTVGCAHVGRLTPSAVVVGDTLHIRFFEDSSAAEPESAAQSLDLGALVFERLDLSGSYAIDDRGELSIPLVGRVDVVGRSLACVEQLVADQYRQAFSNTSSVTASFEARNPVTVIGAVRSPGSYAVTPGMTVRHALALAGTNVAGGIAANQTISNLTARRLELNLLRVGLDLEICRIQAAKELRATIDFEPKWLEELKSVLGEGRVASELAALASTVNSYQLQRESAQSHVEELALRLKLLREQQSVADAQIDNKRDHIKRLRSLSDKGLAPLNQVQAQEQSEKDLERLRLRISLDLATAQNAYNLARRDLEQSGPTFQSQLSEELRERTKELNGIEAQIAAVNMQIDALAQDDDAGSQSSLDLTLTRRTVNKPINFTADFDTELFPGDILEVVAESTTFEKLAHSARPSS